jgi:hypothetical protein
VSTSARRLSASIAAWVVGAVASIAVGTLALSLIDSGPAINADTPQPQMEPQAGTVVSNDPTPSPSGSQTPSAGPHHSSTAAPKVVQRQFTTAGGTVIAKCTGPTVYLLSWSPAQSYRVGNVERGPAAEVEVSFISATRVVEIHIQCVSGIPRTETSWGGGGGGGDR